MTALYLGEDDVKELIDMEESIKLMEQLFTRMGPGVTQNAPRTRVRGEGIMLHTMSAADDFLGYVGWKAYITTEKGAQFHVAVYDRESGRMVALIEADYLGQMRTGAVSGLATESMARPEAAVVGVFGTGLQARTQLKAVCTVRNIQRVEVYSRREENRKLFAEEMSQWCDTEVIPVHAPDEAAAEKDIVICATTSRVPVFEGRILDEGTHLNVVGSNFWHKSEIDVTTISRADVIVCDNIEQCRQEAGDFREALVEGHTDWSLMHELADVVQGKAVGRKTAESVTLFKSVGLAIEDVAMAVQVYQWAVEDGLGAPLPIG